MCRRFSYCFNRRTEVTHPTKNIAKTVNYLF